MNESSIINISRESIRVQALSGMILSSHKFNAVNSSFVYIFLLRTVLFSLKILFFHLFYVFDILRSVKNVFVISSSIIIKRSNVLLGDKVMS